MESQTEQPTDPTSPAGVTLELIAAVATNGVIGGGGGIPWDFPADLHHFEQVTTGHPVIMGRRTFESIVDSLGKPLPDRTSIVLSQSRQDFPESAVHAHSVPDALIRAKAAAADSDVETVFVAGGATVYEQTIDICDRLRITNIPESPDGDTTFPEFNPDDWQLAEVVSIGDSGCSLSATVFDSQ